jgi:hypothetical protein
VAESAHGPSRAGPSTDAESPPAPVPPGTGSAPAADEDPEGLQRRLHELEEQNAQLLGEQAAADRRRREHHRARTTLAAVLVILAHLSVVSVWASNTVGSQDQYVATVAPLATDPAIRSAVTTRVTDAVYARIDAPALVSGALPPKAEVLTQPISNGVKSFINTVVSRIVTSPQFATLWEEANRAAHAQLSGAERSRAPAQRTCRCTTTR